jgi:hypothetical protein
MNRQRYSELISPAIEMVVKKHEDYNTAVGLDAYFPFKDLSYIQMIYIKALRLVNLQTTSAAPNYESINDTLYDLLNYVVFYLDYLEKSRHV